MKSAQVYRGAFIGLSVAFAASGSYAQNALSPKPSLIPGDADVIHDALGIEIGMSCEDAIAKGRQIAVFPFNANAPKRTGGARLDGARISYNFSTYDVVVKVIHRDIGIDTLHFSCLEDGGPREVFEVKREINYSNYAETQQAAPDVTAVRSIFQEKYGVPTVEYSPLQLATLFDRKGTIQNKSNPCAPFEGGSLYDDGFVEFNADKCSYALTFIAVPSRETPNKLAWIRIKIRDHLRLEDAIRAMETHRSATTPVDLPKL